MHLWELRVPLCSVILLHSVVLTVFGSRYLERQNITDGLIQGFRERIIGRHVYHFLGIPYAKPPVGPLRFQRPKPIQPWGNTVVKDATKLPATCIQIFPEFREFVNPATRIWVNNTVMSEDCLYINVWTNSIMNKNGGKPSSKRPVMVWIHGGFFISGSSTLDVYNGAIMASKMDVVVVSMQYRLGALGFLYMGTEDIPGNQGLLDQVLALKWVRNNIEFFGGDSKHVTLFGSSSGAACIALHCLSDLSKDLFEQAILQSGSSVAWWTLETESSALVKAGYFAELTGCNPRHKSLDPVNHMSSCLRSLDPYTIIEEQWNLQSILNSENSLRAQKLYNLYGEQPKPFPNPGEFYFDIPFKPVRVDSFLKAWPDRILYPGSFRRHRIILGVNKNEGIYHLIMGFRSYFMRHYEEIRLPPQFKYGGQAYDPVHLLSYYIMDEKFLHEFLIQVVLFEYEIPTRRFGNTDWTSEDLIRRFDALIGDYNFKCPVIHLANVYANDPHPQVYLYSFEHRTKNFTWPDWTGVMHGYEAEYVFGMPFSETFQRNYYSFTDDERQLSEKIMRFWTNFASTGQPNLHPHEFHTNNDLRWPRYVISSGGPSDSVFTGMEENQGDPKAVSDRTYQYIIFQIKPKISRNLRRHQCVFWEKHLPEFKAKVESEVR